MRGGWHGNGPFLAYAGGPGAWDWRGAWGGVGFGFYPGFAWGIGWEGPGWAWGGIDLGIGVSLIVAPPIFVLPPPIYFAPPPVVLALPAIAPPPLMEGPPPAEPAPPPETAAQGEAQNTAAMVGAAVPPPIVVSPPPAVVALAGPPPLIFAPPSFAFAIAPPELEFDYLGPQFFTAGFFTGGYIARGYYGAAWEHNFYGGGVRYRVGGLGGGIDRFFGIRGGYGWHNGGRPYGGEGYRYQARASFDGGAGYNEGRHEGWDHGRQGGERGGGERGGGERGPGNAHAGHEGRGPQRD